jgi:hypothetical protein
MIEDVKDYNAKKEYEYLDSINFFDDGYADKVVIRRYKKRGIIILVLCVFQTILIILELIRLFLKLF